MLPHFEAFVPEAWKNCVKTLLTAFGPTQKYSRFKCFRLSFISSHSGMSMGGESKNAMNRQLQNDTKTIFRFSRAPFGRKKQRQVCSLLVLNFSPRSNALRFDANLKLKCDKFMFCWHFCLFTFVTARQSQKLSHKVSILKPHSFETNTNDL